MGKCQGKEFPAELKTLGNWKRLVKTQGGWGAVDRVPCRADPREKCFCGEGLEMDPSHISAIEFSKCL